MRLKAAIVCLVAASAFSGCRAYRSKKAEFMRNDARSMTDPYDRVRAIVDADCFVEVGKAPADAPETMACRQTAGPTRLAEAASGARGDEAKTFTYWGECFATTDGSTQSWGSCRSEAEETVAAENQPKVDAPASMPSKMPATSTVTAAPTSTTS